FRGYRLDQQGVPTFLYRVGAFDVEDRFEPAGKGMRRTLQLTAHGRDSTNPATVWFLAHAGEDLAREGDALRAASGLGVTVAGYSAPAQPRPSAGRSEWRIPLDVRKSARIEVKYEW